MPRYTLFNVAGDIIGTAETMQGIGDIAAPGTYSEDTADNRAWRFTAFERDGTMPALVGVPMMHRTDAIEYCKKQGGQ